MIQNIHLFSWEKAKNLALGMLALASIGSVQAQVVTIGTDDYYKANPVEPYYNYSYSQNIYLASEVNQTNGGTIYEITYKCNSTINLSNSKDWKVYMANTSKDSFTSKTDWVAHSDFTMVFDGEVEANDGKVHIMLETPFEYNGTDNLVIAIDENTPDYKNTGKFYNSPTPEDTERCIYYIDDDTNPNPETDLSSLQALTFLKYIANIDLHFTQITCFNPIDIIASNLAENSVDISWVAPTEGTPTKYEYYYSTDDTEPAFDATPSGETPTTTVSLSNLEGATNYNIWVRTVCSDTDKSIWKKGVFKTTCGSYTVAFEDDFNDLPNNFSETCWSMQKEGNTTPEVQIIFNGAANKVLRMYQGSDKQGYMYLISPELTDLDDSKMVTAKIRMGNHDKIESGALEIGVLTNLADVSTFQSIKDLTDKVTKSDVEITALTTDYTGTGGHIVFKYTVPTTSGWNSIYIDDFKYDEVPSCMKPLTISVGDVTGDSATISWGASVSSPANGYEYYHATTNTAPTNTTQSTGTANNITTTITGLEGSTEYFVWIRSVCSDMDKSEWSNMKTFKTECSSETVNYEDNFDGTNGEDNLPQCWSKIIENSVNPNSEVKIKTDRSKSPNKSVNIYHSGDKDGQYYFISPRFSDLDNAKKVSVQIFKKLDPNQNNNPVSTDDNSGTLEVGVMTDATDTTTYSTLQNIPLSSLTQEDWTEVTASTTSYLGGEGHIVFKYMPGTSGWNRFYFDDFKYELNEDLSVQEENVDNQTKVYPNPFTDKITISSIENLSNIVISDVTGKVIETIQPQKEINLRNLNRGVYFISFSYKEGSIKSIKIIKN